MAEHTHPRNFSNAHNNFKLIKENNGNIPQTTTVLVHAIIFPKVYDINKMFIYYKTLTSKHFESGVVCLKLSFFSHKI